MHEKDETPMNIGELLRKPNGQLWLEDSIKHGSDVAYRDGHCCTQCREPIPDDDVVETARECAAPSF
jgi:hypothetical protein